MEWIVAVFAAALVGGFVETEGRKRRREAIEIERKLDLLLEHFQLTEPAKKE